jgi:hypothetical protein
MGEWVRIVGWSVVSALKSRRDLALENVALRHQLMMLGWQHGRVRFKDRDRLFWVWLRRIWPAWHRALVLVQPATVVKWRWCMARRPSRITPSLGYPSPHANPIGHSETGHRVQDLAGEADLDPLANE